MQEIVPLAQFIVNLKLCASEAHTRGESLLGGHGANRVNTEDLPKTAVITPFGIFEFLRMPFGLKKLL